MTTKKSGGKINTSANDNNANNVKIIPLVVHSNVISNDMILISPLIINAKTISYLWLCIVQMYPVCIIVVDSKDQ